MKRAFGWFLAGFVASMASVASARDARLILGKPSSLSGSVDPSQIDASAAPELELLLGVTSGGAVPVTIPQDVPIRDPASSASGEIRYPIYELAAPATGVLSGSGPSTSLRIDAEVLVTWNANTLPMLYDVVVSGAALDSDPTGATLQLVVEGWKRGAERAEPSFRAVVPARIE